MKRIYLKNIKRYAIVDDADYDMLSDFHWWGYKNKNTYYAQCAVNGRKKHMHKLILPNKDSLVDHKNRNGLDNRISNLRYATHSTNRHNSRAPINNTSGYKGVTYDKLRKKWRAQICVYKKYTPIGYFETKYKAAKARKEFECQLSQ